MKMLVVVAVFVSLLAGGNGWSATIADLIRTPGDCSANNTVCVWVPTEPRAQTQFATTNPTVPQRIANALGELIGFAAEHGAPTDMGTPQNPLTPFRVVFLNRLGIPRYLPSLAERQWAWANGAFVVNQVVTFGGEFIRNDPPEYLIGSVTYGALGHYVETLLARDYNTLDGFHPWIRQQTGSSEVELRWEDVVRNVALTESMRNLSHDARFQNLVVKRVMRRLGEPCPPSTLCAWEFEPE